MTPYACALEHAAPYGCASVSPFEVSPEAPAHKPYNCSCHLYYRFCSKYHWWWARLDCCCCLVRYTEYLKHSAGKIWNVCERQPCCPSHTVCVMWQVQLNLVPRTPEAKIDVRPSDVWYTIATSTRQPVNVGLAQARPNTWDLHVKWAANVIHSQLLDQRP